jgi:hypothetical protein
VERMRNTHTVLYMVHRWRTSVNSRKSLCKSGHVLMRRGFQEEAAKDEREGILRH